MKFARNFDEWWTENKHADFVDSHGVLEAAFKEIAREAWAAAMYACAREHEKLGQDLCIRALPKMP